MSEKYAVIYTETINIPGDERSRTNPGHGYPAHTQESSKIEEFDSMEKLKAWIDSNEKYHRRSFRAIAFNELKIVRETRVEVTRA